MFQNKKNGAYSKNKHCRDLYTNEIPHGDNKTKNNWTRLYSTNISDIFHQTRSCPKN